MPTPQINRVKCVLSGQVFPGQTWSVGIWCEVQGQGGLPNGARLEGYLDEIAPLISAAIATGIASRWDAATNFSRISLYAYAAGARTATYIANRDVPVVGGSAGQNAPYPPYLAVVTTLLTALSGRRYRGRIYWPLTGTAAVAAFHVAQGVVNDATITTLAIVEALGDAGGGVDGDDLVPIVSSEAGGFVTPITAVSTDNVPDAQRNRDNGLTASYRDRRAVVA